MVAWPVREPSAALPAQYPVVDAFAAKTEATALQGAWPLTASAQRVGTLRRMDPYPLHAVASIDTAVVTAAWRRQIAGLAALTAAVAFGLSWLGHIALNRTQLELEVARRLQDESLLRAGDEASLLHARKLEGLGASLAAWRMTS